MFSVASSVIGRRVPALARGARARFMSTSVPQQKVFGAAGAGELDTGDLFKGKNVLVGVVGAFTSVCDAQVPSFASAIDQYRAKGVDNVVVLTVNDPVVVGAWKDALGVGDEITFLADWDASFTKTLGQDIDLAVAGLGVRSNRFAMVIEDGEIKSTAVEESPGDLKVTAADAVLAQL